MVKAKTGDKVQIRYTGSLEDGSIFESTDKVPFEFTLGEGKVIPGFETAIIGMSEGEKKTVTIPPEDAYGYSNNKAITEVDKTQIPSYIEPEIGMMLKARTTEGKTKSVTVINISEKTVTLDGNHPLAGKKLTFEIHLESVVNS